MVHQLDRRRSLREMILGTAGSIAGTVYGTIVVMGAIVAGAAAGETWHLSAVVAATVLVLWLAHVYAHGLGEAIARGRRLDREELVSVARRELAIPLAAVAPIAALALGGVGLVEHSTAVWIALVIALATLGVQGFRYAQLEGLGRGGIVKSVGVNLTLGLSLVALKVALGH